MPDWLFETTVAECNENMSYTGSTQPYEPPARFFMSVLWLLSAIAVWLMPQRPTETAPPPTSVVLRPHPRWDMLDLVRVCSIVAVVCEHSDGWTYSYHNTGFVTMIVLPWLCVVSGVAFAMSRSSAFAYFARLGLLFAVGMGFNIAGDMISRPNWIHDIGNTVFQMSFVVAIAFFALVAWPLRATLRAELVCASSRANQQAADASPPVERQGTPCAYLALGLYGAAWLVLAAWYLSGQQLDVGVGDSSWAEHVGPIIRNTPWIASHVAGLLALAALHVALGKAPDGMLPWLLLPYIYVPRILFPMSYAIAPQLIMSYLFGLICQAQPLYGAATFAKYAGSYWLLLGTFLIILSMPNMLGRCDLYPAPTLWERFRWDTIEAVLTLLLLTKTLASADPCKLVTPLSWWALFAYCSHLFFSRVFPVIGLPSSTGVVVEVILMPTFVIGFKLRERCRADADESKLLASAAQANSEDREAAYGTFKQ